MCLHTLRTPFALAQVLHSASHTLHLPKRYTAPHTRALHEVPECMRSHHTYHTHAHRYAAGLLLRELLRSAPEAFAAQAASEVLPVAFGAKMDEDTDVAAVWKEVGV